MSIWKAPSGLSATISLFLSFVLSFFLSVLPTSGLSSLPVGQSLKKKNEGELGFVASWTPPPHPITDHPSLPKPTSALYLSGPYLPPFPPPTTHTSTVTHSDQDAGTQ